MKICPTCGREYEGDDYVKCPFDGVNLVDPAAMGSDPLIGARFGQSYEIVRILGEGGMGRVYEARHVRLSKRYAIKVLHPQFNSNQETIARFRREAEAASAIGQENILDVVDFNETPDGVYYIVTEYLDGRNLGQVLREDGLLETARSLAILHQIARALQAAHAHGIVHRDLKPENIFLVRRFETNDFVKVLDFGISKMRSEGARLTQTGQIIGTPHYMSPEQAQGELNLDHRSDVYSFGAIMYEMFTGHLPYSGDSVQKILVKLLTEPLPPPRTRRPELPEDIEGVILRLMAHDPAARYGSMTEVDQAILGLWSTHVGADAPSPMQMMGLSSAPDHVMPMGMAATAPSQPGISAAAIARTGAASLPTGASAGGGVASTGPGTTPPVSGGVGSPTGGWGAPGRSTVSPAGQAVTRSGAKRGGSIGLLVVLVLLLLGGGGGALWYFVLRDSGEPAASDREPEAATPGAAMLAGSTSRRRAVAARPRDRPRLRRHVASAAPRIRPRRFGPSRSRRRGSASSPTVGMVRVAGGSFTQGRKDGSKTEGPPIRNVRVATFYLDAAEVSRAEYARFLAGKGKSSRSPWGASRTPPAGSGELPVTNITWQEARAYCRAVGRRLPTEAEWEYAARGPTHDRLYPWGNSFDPAKVVCSVAAPGRLAPVRSGAPLFGFYHLVGNAWEWVGTRYKLYPGSRAAPARGVQYVIRGGGADTRKAAQLTATYRVFNYGHRNPKTKKLVIYKFLGFRCARDAAPRGGM